MESSNNSRDDDFDILDDLLISEAKERDRKNEESGQNKLNIENEEYLKLKKYCQDLEEDNAQLQKNMGLLWKTAKVQIVAKEKELAKLKREKEALIFRRAMRTISKDDLQRVVSHIAAYQPEEFEAFLAVLSPKECECSSTQPAAKKLNGFAKTLEKIKISVLGKRVLTNGNLLTVANKIHKKDGLPYKEIALKGTNKKKKNKKNNQKKQGGFVQTNLQEHPSKRNSNCKSDSNVRKQQQSSPNTKIYSDGNLIKPNTLSSTRKIIEAKVCKGEFNNPRRSPRKRARECSGDEPASKKPRIDPKDNNHLQTDTGDSVVLKDSNIPFVQKEPAAEIGKFSDGNPSFGSYRIPRTTSSRTDDERDRVMERRKEKENHDLQSRKSQKRESSSSREDKKDLRSKIGRKNPFSIWGRDSSSKRSPVRDHRRDHRRSPPRSRHSRTPPRRSQRQRTDHRRDRDKYSRRSPNRRCRDVPKESTERGVTRRHNVEVVDEWVAKSPEPATSLQKTKLSSNDNQLGDSAKTKQSKRRVHNSDREDGEISSDSTSSSALQPPQTTRQSEPHPDDENTRHPQPSPSKGNKDHVPKSPEPPDIIPSRQMEESQPNNESTLNAASIPRYPEEDTIDRLVREHNERQSPVELGSDDSEMSLLLFLGDSPPKPTPQAKEKTPSQETAQTFSSSLKNIEFLSPVPITGSNKIVKPPEVSRNVSSLFTNQMLTPKALSEPNCSPITPATPLNDPRHTPNPLSKTRGFGEQKSSTPIVASFNLDEKMKTKRSSDKTTFIPKKGATLKHTDAPVSRGSVVGKKKIPFVTLSTTVSGVYAESDNSMECSVANFSRQRNSSSSIPHSFVQKKKESLMQSEASRHTEASSCGSSCSCSSTSSSSSSVSESSASRTISSSISTPQVELSFSTAFRQMAASTPTKQSASNHPTKMSPPKISSSPRCIVPSSSSNSADTSSPNKLCRRTISSVNLEGASGNTILSSIDADGGFLSESKMAALDGEVGGAAITSFGSRELDGLRASLRDLDAGVLSSVNGESPKSPSKSRSPNKPVRKSARLSSRPIPQKTVVSRPVRRGKNLSTLRRDVETNPASCFSLPEESPEKLRSPIPSTTETTSRVPETACTTVTSVGSKSSPNNGPVKAEPIPMTVVVSAPQKIRVKVRKKRSMFGTSTAVQFQSSPISQWSAGPSQTTKPSNKRGSDIQFQCSDVQYV